MTSAAARAIEAVRDPDRVLARLRKEGERIAHVVGSDAPRELLLACGLTPVRMVANPDTPTPAADGLIGQSEMSPRSRSFLEQLLVVPATEIVVLTHAEAELPQLFAVLRELSAQGEVRPGPVFLLDLRHLDRDSTLRYNLTRLAQLRAALAEAGFACSDDKLRGAIALTNEQRRLLLQAATHTTGAEFLGLLGSAALLPPREHLEIMEALASENTGPRLTGPRVLLTGSRHEDDRWYQVLESCGIDVVAHDHDWGDAWLTQGIDATVEPMQALAAPALRRPMLARTIPERERLLQQLLRGRQPDSVIELCLPGDEAAPWQSPQTRQFCEQHGLPLLHIRAEDSRTPEAVRACVEAFIRRDRGAESISLSVKPVRATPAASAGTRSRKSLRSLAMFGDYQRQWFADLRARAARGEPIAVVNANAPQEILRALDVPFVVNQWWASIVAAKQQSPRYLDLLRERHYPIAIDAYSSQGLAALFDDDPANAPWGGLPRPQLLHALNSTDGAAKLFESWALAADADLFLFERTVDSRWQLFREWWTELPDHWDTALEPERLDLLASEMRLLIAQLEQRLGRSFSLERFAAVMTLVNEQEDWYRRTRDLIATTVPAPVSVVDTMPATMTPQWHRGTLWARDAARAFHDEVAQRAAAGEAACPNERVRLMWVGRGLWSDMGFYQRWEESHGAVFVWSMYLALAADGYIRRFDGGRDPLRALAARVATMGDELRMPTWAAAWHVHEARTHLVDGAVALSDADPFVLRSLQQAGIPVLSLSLDNFNHEGSDRTAIERAVTTFIEGPVSERSRARQTVGAV